MSKLLCLLGLAAAWLSPVSTWAQTPLSLDRALTLALSHSPDLAAATKEIEALEGAARQAGIRRNPELSTTIENARPDSRTTTVTLGLPIELGHKRTARMQAAAHAVEVAAATQQQLQARVRAHVMGLFFETLVAQERVQLAHRSLWVATRATEAVAKRVSAGKVSPVESNRARVDQANAQLELADAQGAQRTAQASLAYAMGEQTWAFELVSADGLQAPMRPTFNELLPQLETAPALLAGQREVAQRQAALEVERSKRIPDVLLTLGGKRDASADSNQAIVGMSVALPLFDRNQGAIWEANRRAAQAQDALEATRLRALAELQDSTTRLQVAGDSLRVLQDVVLPAAQAAQEAASQGFDAGKFGFLEVLDAQRTLLQARTRYLNTLAAAYQAAAAIDRITGR